MPMLWPMKAFLVLGALLLVQSAWSLVDGYRFLHFVRRRRSRPVGNYAPPAAAVIPCKGVDADFESNLDRFLTQDYPNYQVVFVVAAPSDPAYKRLQERLATPPESGVVRTPKTSLVVAGISDERGDKVNNLLHGLEVLDQSVEALVFADIDASPSPDWLRSLVAPLANPRITVSTGFRWYLPGEGFVSQLRAAWDTSIATLLGDHDHNFAWGGSMAIRAADFRRLRVAECYWANTVSDDYALTRAVREVGGRIEFEPRCLVASKEESSLWEFLRWSNRQIIITRVYAAHLWRRGLAAYGFYCGSFVLGGVALLMPGVTVRQRLAVAGTLLAILLLGADKGRIRSIVARGLFPAEAARLQRLASRYWQLTPVVPWVMLGNFLVAGFTRRIEWRGTQYELVSPQKVRVLGRDHL
jgi:cellulose synthase/poly-beta-1,6-N-acetylglucosamine synthase-like glycosyltransferase